jgi:hypothetical protein
MNIEIQLIYVLIKGLNFKCFQVDYFTHDQKVHRVKNQVSFLKGQMT